tara:strand:+ start:368 stop:583 length:216 start_codon:yes stop_codon:yes gene_type:complete
MPKTVSDQDIYNMLKKFLEKQESKSKKPNQKPKQIPTPKPTRRPSPPLVKQREVKRGGKIKKKASGGKVKK